MLVPVRPGGEFRRVNRRRARQLMSGRPLPEMKLLQ